MGSLTPSATSSASASTITTTTDTTSSSTSTSQSPLLLEITLISAQDLAPVSKSMRTYAVLWVHPDRKLTSRVDNKGNSNPTWNDKFVFHVETNDLFSSESSAAVTVEIYTVSWFCNNLVGTVRVLINNLIPHFSCFQTDPSTRFVALQVRRASGSPQGILNLGVSIVNTSMEAMPACAEHGSSATGKGDSINKKLHMQLWRSRSDQRSDFEFEEDQLFTKEGSICNGSALNGSMVCSDVGPSASIVAAAIAKGLYPLPSAPPEKGSILVAGDVEDGGSSILEELTVEEATAKGYKKKAERWRTDLPPMDQKLANSRHSRRHSDSDGGLFSCFVYGFEFTIVCGANSKNNNNHRNKKIGDKPIKRSPSLQNLKYSGNT